MMDLSIRVSVETLMRDNADLRAEIEELERKQGRERDSFLRDIFEIADGVERSIFLTDGPAAEFLGAIARQIEQTLTDNGIQVFRPSIGSLIHGLDAEAVASIQDAQARPGTVTKVIRAGYRADNRIIRRAGVEIVKE